MAIPTGAFEVEYTISAYDESDSDPEIGTKVSFPISDGAPYAAAQDAAAQAAAEAYVAAIEAAYPTTTVNASRSYICRVPGDAWPS
jgi:hypothetical protein